MTSIEHPLEVDAETLFQIGSITKTVTGTLALQLVEKGELDLDAPIRRYLPTLRLADDDVAERVTTRHLLTHTGGWYGDYFADPSRGDDALERILPELAELPQLAPLGQSGRTATRVSTSPAASSRSSPASRSSQPRASSC